MKKQKLETIHQRIKYVRECLGLTQSELARHIEVRPQMVNQWEKGPKAPHTDNLFKIHQLSGAPIAWLLFGGDLPAQNGDGRFVQAHEGRVVPMRTLLEAAQGVQSAANSETFITTYPCSTKAFAVRIPDASNAPRFPQGTTMVFDRDVTPQPTDVVLAVVGKQRQPVIGEFRMEGTRKGKVHVVQPINEAFPAARSDVDQVEIVGVMTEATLRGRNPE